MFQQDIYRLRLMTARSYVKAITSSMNPVSANSNESLKLSAQVHGLGPVFRLVIELVNSSQRPSVNLFLTFDFDSKLYSLDKTYIPIAFMVSGVSYQFDTLIRCISSLNVTDTVKVSRLQCLRKRHRQTNNLTLFMKSAKHEAFAINSCC